MNGKRLRVLDVCSGTGSTTQAFLDRGHRVVRVDNDQKFDALHLDVRHLAKNPEEYLGDWRPDVLIMEPPCTKFTTNGKADSWLHFDKGQMEAPDPFFGKRFPKDAGSREAVALVLACLELRRKLGTKLWWMENPQGGLQTMGFMVGEMSGPIWSFDLKEGKHPPGEVFEIRDGPINRLSGCEVVQRTTVTYCQYGDTRMKPTTLWGNFGPWIPKPRCYNGDPCHEAAVRGAMTGTRGLKNATERGRVPYALSESIVLACEKEVGGRVRNVA